MFFVDNDPMHHGNLAGGSAEAEQRYARPYAERLA
jgi:hypothetical protein